MEIWSRRLMALFEGSGQTYREVSGATGIPVTALHRYVNGGTANIPLDRLEKLARHFGVGTNYLAGWDADGESPDANGDLMVLRERLRRQPGMRILFDASRNATEQDLLDAAHLIEGFKKRRDGEE